LAGSARRRLVVVERHDRVYRRPIADDARDVSPPRQIVGRHVQTRVGVDTVAVLEWRMLLPSRRHGAVEDGGWCAAAESITIMRPVDVTEAQEAPEAAVQRPLLWLQV